jgi:hypothetical protein
MINLFQKIVGGDRIRAANSLKNKHGCQSVQPDLAQEGAQVTPEDIRV